MTTDNLRNLIKRELANRKKNRPLFGYKPQIYVKYDEGYDDALNWVLKQIEDGDTYE